MQVKMKHRLASGSSRVRHDAVARLRHTLLFRNVRTDEQEVRQEIRVLRSAVLQGRDMQLWNDQSVDRSLGVDIVEGQRTVILEHNLGRDRFLYDFTKQTIGHGVSSGD
jgi:hypothetical protein